MCASPAIGKSRSPNLTFGAAKKGAQMETRQEVRLKEAEAADQKETANRDRFAEPTASIIDVCRTKVHTDSTLFHELDELVLVIGLAMQSTARIYYCPQMS